MSTTPCSCKSRLVDSPNLGRLVVSAALLSLLLPGCAGLRGNRANNPFGPKVACVLPKDPTVSQVVEHVNRNVAKVQSWRSNSVKIRAQSVPVPLSGNLVVEGNRRLRLEVTSALNKEVDLGSNDELLWLWMKPRGDMPHAVYYAAHENMDVARQQLPLPFEPEWLMEALGVAALSAENTTLETQPGVGTLRLVSYPELPDRTRIKKEIVVHGCHGYVMEHNIYDAYDQPVIHVVLQDYQLDKATGATLPHHVRLHWPQTEMSLTMDIPQIEVNPPSISPLVWQMPHMPGTTMVNLGDPRTLQYASRPQAPNRPPGATRAQADQQVATGSENLDDIFLMPRQESQSQSSPTETPKVRWQEPVIEEPAWDADVSPTSRAEVEDSAGRATLALEPF